MVNRKRLRRNTPIGQFRADRKNYYIIFGLGIFRESLIALLVLSISSISGLCGYPIPHARIIAVLPLMLRVVWGIVAGLKLWRRHRQIARDVSSPLP